MSSIDHPSSKAIKAASQRLKNSRSSPLVNRCRSAITSSRTQFRTCSWSIRTMQSSLRTVEARATGRLATRQARPELVATLRKSSFLSAIGRFSRWRNASSRPRKMAPSATHRCDRISPCCRRRASRQMGPSETNRRTVAACQVRTRISVACRRSRQTTDAPRSRRSWKNPLKRKRTSLSRHKTKRTTFSRSAPCANLTSTRPHRAVSPRLASPRRTL